MQRQSTSGDRPILLSSPPEDDPLNPLRADPASGRLARALIKARTARRQFFDEHLFADPAWDMLLELYALNCEGHRISVSKLSLAAGVPGTTGLRWIDKLEDEALIARASDPLDKRRVWVSLTEFGLMTLSLYLEQIPVRQLSN